MNNIEQHLLALAQSPSYTQDAAVNYIPWIELSSGKDEPYFLNAVDGLTFARQYAKAAIVTTDEPNYADIAEIVARFPDLQIMPGLKPGKTLHNKLADADAWKAVGEMAWEMAESAGSRVFVLELESRTRTYYSGEAQVDLEAVTEAVKRLPPLDYWWYPSAAGSGDTLDRYLALVKAVQDSGISVRFIDHASLYGPSASRQAGTLRCADELRKATTLHPLCMAYVIGGPSWWEPQDIEMAAAIMKHRFRDRIMIVYPGWKRWVACNRVISTLKHLR